jgi:probable rRNA maturation factor
MKKISFFKEYEDFEFDEDKIKIVLDKLFSVYRVSSYQINIIFMDNESLLKINIDYLKHNDYTDIITFDLSDNEELKSGELYISVERVKENSEELSVPFSEELNRVMIHGCLHLCGLNDKTETEKKEMRKQEEHYLKLYTDA